MNTLTLSLCKVLLGASYVGIHTHELSLSLFFNSNFYGT